MFNTLRTAVVAFFVLALVGFGFIAPAQAQSLTDRSYQSAYDQGGLQQVAILMAPDQVAHLRCLREYSTVVGRFLNCPEPDSRFWLEGGGEYTFAFQELEGPCLRAVVMPPPATGVNQFRLCQQGSLWAVASTQVAAAPAAPVAPVTVEKRSPEQVIADWKRNRKQSLGAKPAPKPQVAVAEKPSASAGGGLIMKYTINPPHVHQRMLEALMQDVPVGTEVVSESGSSLLELTTAPAKPEQPIIVILSVKRRVAATRVAEVTVFPLDGTPGSVVTLYEVVGQWVTLSPVN